MSKMQLGTSHRKSIRRASIVAIAILVLSPTKPVSAVGGQFGLEFAIDAPWRIEPMAGASGQYTYPAIPINITFHDTIFEGGRGELASMQFEKISVGKIVGVRISEMGTNLPSVSEIPVGALSEIELKRDLSVKAAEPQHLICRPTTGQLCSEDFFNISDTHEWHGVFWYAPKTTLTPGKNVYLKVTVKTLSRESIRVGSQTLSIEVPKEWTNFLTVHMGEAPLPRFGADWLYGDLHYHSQMTDNEGESAYSYRNVARALGASGMDFVFATDHASNGEQVDGKVGGRIEARDLNRSRFSMAKSIIYGPDGANQLIADEAVAMHFPRYRSARIVPQVYMGEEIDAWPEISAREFADGLFYFGDFGLKGAAGLRYQWLWRQQGFTDCLHAISGTSFEECKSKYAKAASPATDSFLLFDDQGIPVSQEIDNYVPPLGSAINYGNWLPYSVKPYPSRQHIVYFPLDSRLSSNGWIGSDTGVFGGGSKRLQQVVREIEAGGFAFLAHPIEDLEPGSINGPDVVPYSEQSLIRAWRSPAILGLQFWNENDRYRSAPTPVDQVVKEEKTYQQISTIRFVTKASYTYPWPFLKGGPDVFRWQQYGQTGRSIVSSTINKLHHGAGVWDRFLRKGLDRQQTVHLAWLSQGEPRKWFMAGGSDSHGDWNYRRYGRPDPTNRWNDVPVGDTAIGNPRNLVSMRAPSQEITVAMEGAILESGLKRYSNRDVIASLRAGRFSVTDGPALRIAIDKNRNGRIEDSDFQMGSTFDFFPGEHIPLLVEWNSTQEFGPIDQIDVYVGNSQETFAAKSHGPGLLPLLTNVSTGQTEDYGGYAHDPSAALQIRLADQDGRFNRVDVPDSVRYHGVARIFLGPAQFRLISGDGALTYVRASARTITDGEGQLNGVCPNVGAGGSKCGDRFAFANPIWAKYRIACPAGPRRPSMGTSILNAETTYLDADSNQIPDVCEHDIPNPCVDPHRPVTGILGGQTPPASPDRGGTGARGGGIVGVDVNREGVFATDETLGQPSPAKPIPNSSCQWVGVPKI